ncbi:hypothetical protein CYMTET_8569, partial [Cymbomonas tetramitiformis]|eukprot:gene2950-3765_t
MGVHNLWNLLEPCGRRITVEALGNKVLAVDASIWLVQFIKAMRDDRGEMVRNAHLLGFFRRICRMLFHRIRPVFVFDGATPALKRRTTALRRRLKEKQSAKIRKTAEKLLLNQLKTRVIDEISLQGAHGASHDVASGAVASQHSAGQAGTSRGGSLGAGAAEWRDGSDNDDAQEDDGRRPSFAADEALALELQSAEYEGASGAARASQPHGTRRDASK